MKIQTENMTAQLITKGVTQTLSIVATVVCIALLPVHAQGQVQAKAKTQYNVSNLPDFGGTSSGGNSINDQSWAAGYSRLPTRSCSARAGVARLSTVRLTTSVTSISDLSGKTAR